MSDQLRRDTLFVVLTRPQLFAGVTYTFFIMNAVLEVEMFLIFRAWWVLLAAPAVHGIGMLLSLDEPRIFDHWITRMRNCPRVKNYRLWQSSVHSANRALRSIYVQHVAALQVLNAAVKSPSPTLNHMGARI